MKQNFKLLFGVTISGKFVTLRTMITVKNPAFIEGW